VQRSIATGAPNLKPRADHLLTTDCEQTALRVGEPLENLLFPASDIPHGPALQLDRLATPFADAEPRRRLRAHKSTLLFSPPCPPLTLSASLCKVSKRVGSWCVSLAGTFGDRPSAAR